MDKNTPAIEETPKEDIILPKKKSFFQKLSKSQKISLGLLIFAIVVLPAIAFAAQLQTKLRSRAYLPATPPITVPTVTPSISPTSSPSATPTPAGKISCIFEVYKADSRTVYPYLYGTPLNQNLTKITSGQYYLYGLKVTNNTKTPLSRLKVSVTQLHQGKEPITIVNTDRNCIVSNTNKSIQCSPSTTIMPGRTSRVAAGHVVRILPANGIDVKTSSMYTITSNLGTTQCANMLFYAQRPTITPTPTICKRGINSWSSGTSCKTSSGTTGMMSARYQCYGSTIWRTATLNRCATASELNQIATKACASASNCPITPTPTSRCVNQGLVCTQQYSPVCGTDGKTYGNSCMAKANCASIACTGACPCRVTPTPTRLTPTPTFIKAY